MTTIFSQPVLIHTQTHCEHVINYALVRSFLLLTLTLLSSLYIYQNVKKTSNPTQVQRRHKYLISIMKMSWQVKFWRKKNILWALLSGLCGFFSSPISFKKRVLQICFRENYIHLLSMVSAAVTAHRLFPPLLCKDNLTNFYLTLTLFLIFIPFRCFVENAGMYHHGQDLQTQCCDDVQLL